MNDQLASVGKCLFCNNSFTQKGISKHLESHLKIFEKQDSTKKTETYFHIAVEADLMFLHLLVKGNVLMSEIDYFLLDIWLDCCQHMSNFGHKDYDISFDDKVSDVFSNKIKIYHDYDFGSTTRVFLKGINKYSLHQKEDIFLLSRNEPLKLMCTACGKKPAVNICTECDWSFYCTGCSKKHEKVCNAFGEYSKMPIVNSPRMGVCGYEGGRIDLERDGAYRELKIAR